MLDLAYIENLQPLWGKWYVEKHLSSGSQCEVFLISKTEFNYKYNSALKVVKLPLNENKKHIELQKEVLDEVQFLYSLRGESHIVVYEDHQIIKKTNDNFFLLLLRMEYLKTLTNHIETSEKITLGMILNMAMDICSALECCHKNNIIHRDIKPANIFYNGSTFKLGDFSVSKKIDEFELFYTSVGTPVYAAPEVILNQPYNITTDIYSFCLVLYQILNANRLPFTPLPPHKVKSSDLSLSISQRLQKKNLPPPHNCYNELSKLAKIILKGCEFHQEKRFQSAQELKSALYDIYKTLSHEQLTLNLFAQVVSNQSSLQPKTELITQPLNHNLKTELITDINININTNQSVQSSHLATSSLGNITNGSLFVEDQNFLFLSDPYQNLTLSKEDKKTNKSTVILHDYCFHLSLYKNILFFTSGINNDHIFALDLVSNTIEKFIEYTSTNLIIHKDFLYFINKDDENKVFKFNINSYELSNVLNESIKEFLIADNHLFFIDYSENIYSQNFAKNKKKLLTFDKAKNLNYYNNKIYYVNKSSQNRIFELNLKTDKTNALSKSSCDYLNVHKENILFSNTNDNYCAYTLNVAQNQENKIYDKPSEYIHMLSNQILFVQTSEPKALIRLPNKKSRVKIHP